MSFGLINISTNFQTLINDILKKYLDVFITAYFDNILIYLRTLSEHKKHVKKIFIKLAARRLKLKLLKYKFYKKELEYLKFIIGRYDIKITLNKIKNVLDWLTLRNIKKVIGFLGTAGFNRNFIKKYSEKTEPLTDITRKNKKFQETSKKKKMFRTLKKVYTFLLIF